MFTMTECDCISVPLFSAQQQNMYQQRQFSDTAATRQLSEPAVLQQQPDLGIYQRQISDPQGSLQHLQNMLPPGSQFLGNSQQYPSSGPYWHYLSMRNEIVCICRVRFELIIREWIKRCLRMILVQCYGPRDQQCLWWSRFCCLPAGLWLIFLSG